MSVKFYDEAVKGKLKALFPNVEFQSRELAFKTITDRVGKVSFPYITVFRPDGWSIGSSNSWVNEREFLNGLRQVSIDATYVIDIYANTREDLEDLTAELVLYLLRNPGVTVHYETADGTEAVDVEADLKYISGPERTSELDDTTVGRPYRYTLTFALQNAYIYVFSGNSQGEEGYYPKVTQVIVEVIPEVRVINNKYIRR